MHVIIIILVIIGTILAIASGIWVAVSLMSAISTRRDTSTAAHDANNSKNS